MVPLARDRDKPDYSRFDLRDARRQSRLHGNLTHGQSQRTDQTYRSQILFRERQGEGWDKAVTLEFGDVSAMVQYASSVFKIISGDGEIIK